MKLTIRETAIFGFLGALMYTSKLLMEGLTNIHLIAVFTVVFTVVYRRKALYPIYIFVLLCGLFGGFDLWWIPHLYLWLILWGAAMLIPKDLPPRLCSVCYAVLCSIHGFLYGLLYAPAQALMFGYSFDQTVKWVIEGIPYDITHGISNLFLGFSVLPLVTLLRQLERK